MPGLVVPNPPDRRFHRIGISNGITEHPMMLATSKESRSKEDVIRTAKLYFPRWRIEEYFR